MKFYKYGDPKASWSYIIIFTIIEIMFTIGLPIIPTIIAWKYMSDLTLNTRSILCLYIYLMSLFIVIKIKGMSMK